MPSKADNELISGGVFLCLLSTVIPLRSYMMLIPFGPIIYIVTALVFCILCTVLIPIGIKDKIDEMKQK